MFYLKRVSCQEHIRGFSITSFFFAHSEYPLLCPSGGFLKLRIFRVEKIAEYFLDYPYSVSFAYTQRLVK